MMTARTTPRRTADDIVDAVCDAAHRLFVDRAPSAVSLREIAAASDVNLGLIHRYVGSKDTLIALVLQRHIARISVAVSALEDRSERDLLKVAADAGVADPSTGRLIAGMIRDGVDIPALSGEFPLFDRLIGDSDGDALDSVMIMALLLGWDMFGPTLLRAVRASPDDSTVSDALLDAVTAIRQ